MKFTIRLIVVTLWLNAGLATATPQIELVAEFGDRQCSNKKLIDPIAEYSHDQGCSVTGGYVYRGKKIPLLAGWYVFADYCSGTIWGFDTQQTPAQVMQILKTETNISSFAEAHDGELFILDHGKGGIFRLVPGR